ncbi:MAG: MBL fold metallo-hydrolase [Lachnospiraceae bacterium]|nr:MBL fold metallo-hydrolase [Lachnospiraceae bacterium]
MDLNNISINLHSSIRIAGAKVLYFDPFKIEVGAHDADVIFVTHEHYDHFDPSSIAKVAKAGTVVVAPKSMKDIMEKESGAENIMLLEPGVTAGVCGIAVETVRAYNVGKQFHPKERDWNGYIVTLDGVRYYVAGDTDANEDNKKVQCDVALIPAGGTYTFDSKEAAEYALHLKPKAVIPTHYGSVVGKPGDGADFKKYVEAAGAGIQVELII